MAQIEFYWSYHLLPRLKGLTDEEYFWEPVPNCWSIRQVDGTWKIDWAWPTPDPAPVTTIAWRLAHLGVQTFGIRWSTHFGDGSLTLDTVKWPSTARDAVTELSRYYHLWVTAIQGMDEASLARPVGPQEHQWGNEPFAGLAFHLNREFVHHGAEVCLLRDLYRAGTR
ncbi:DinB family protein [Actinophytocola oryzae]|uniref:DinB family protein n=1 Tax=Actinophytocola oryzae TaxID=502181 RepID=UPI001FB98BB6|nr:DinB family protein [Actinophytocola oryzae]